MKWLIKKYMAQAKINSYDELYKEAGMKKATFYKRLAHPRTLTIPEIEALNEVLNFSDEDMLLIIKGGIEN